MRPNAEAGLWYLASPYSTPINTQRFSKILQRIPMPEIREERHELVQRAGHSLYKLGYVLIEPIASSHYKALHFASPAHYDYWKKRDRTFIEHCIGVIVLDIEGWRESTGVTDEISYAKELGKQVWLACFDDPLVQGAPVFTNISSTSIDQTTWKPKIEKSRIDLNPPEADYSMAAAFEDGAKKYGDHSWEINGFSVKERCIAIKRHANRILMGELIAPDSGVLHSGHIQANSAMISTAYIRGMKDKKS